MSTSPERGAYQSAPIPPISTPPRFQTRTIVWPVLLSLLVLSGIGYYTYQPGMFDHLARVFNPLFLLVALLLLVARVGMGAWRLRYVSHGNLSRGQALRGQLIWDFCSNITPSVIGGAPFAALYIAKDAEKPVGEITAIMLYAMLLDQIWFAVSIPIMLFASFYIEVIPQGAGFWGKGAITAYFIGMLVWVTLFAYATLLKPHLLKKVVSWLFSFRLLVRFQERVDAELSALEERATMIGKQPAMFYLNGFLMSAFTWVSRYALLLFIVWSVDRDVDSLQILLRTMAMLLLGLPVPSPGGAGGVELLYVVFIGSLILDPLITPTLLTWRVLGYYIFIIIGIFLTTQKVNQTIVEKWLDKSNGVSDSADLDHVGTIGSNPVPMETTPPPHST